MRHKTNIQNGQSGKMSQELFQAIKEGISEQYCTKWQKQGRWSLNGESWMRNISECPKEEDIFVIACYDPAIAGRCPDQILPISEGLPRHIEEGKQKRQETSAKIDEGVIGEAIVFENSYRDAARIAKDGITQTLSAKMGTGGNNVPMLAFYTQFGSNANVFEEHSPTLKASQQPPSVMFYDGYNQKLDGSGIHRSLRTGRDSGDFVAQESEVQTIIRRLTPIECERLMGWPDDHTKWKSDGKQQADSHRYKQVGNGVATPVAKWIGQQIMSIHTKKD